MHNKMFKSSYCLKLSTLEVHVLKTKGFQQYALFERRTKLLYMIFLLVDARWRCTTRYPHGTTVPLGIAWCIISCILHSHNTALRRNAKVHEQNSRV